MTPLIFADRQLGAKKLFYATKNKKLSRPRKDNLASLRFAGQAAAKEVFFRKMNQQTEMNLQGQRCLAKICKSMKKKKKGKKTEGGHRPVLTFKTHCLL